MASGLDPSPYTTATNCRAMEMPLLLARCGTICVSRDITDRVARQRARDQAEIKYRMLVEQVAAVSYIAELACEANALRQPQIESMFGYAADEWLSTSKSDRHIPAEDHPIVHAAENQLRVMRIHLEGSRASGFLGGMHDGMIFGRYVTNHSFEVDSHSSARSRTSIRFAADVEPLASHASSAM